MTEFFQHAASWSIHGAAVLLCLIGLFISLLSISGTWLVALAAALLTWCRDDSLPGWPLVAVLLALSVVVEVIDFVAGSLGIARRGGSSAAGWAALIGGLFGMVAGSIIPIPVVGGIIGMCAGSFAFAFWVERRRLQHDAHAAHIAWGAVWARLGVMFIKTLATLGMTAAMWYGIMAG